MSTRLIFIFTLAAAGFALWLRPGAAPETSAVQESAKFDRSQRSSPGTAVVDRPADTSAKLTARPDEQPFWEDGQVPEPERPRLPRSAAVPKGQVKPGLSLEAVREGVTSSPLFDSLSAGSQSALNANLARWHALAPDDAAAWMESQPSFMPFQDAIREIAYRHSEDNEPHTALEWAALLQDSAIREETRTRILALGLANGLIEPAEVGESGLSPENQSAALSGAAID